MSEDELLTLSACLEEHFPHPVSRAIVDAAEEKGLAHHDEQHDAEVKYVVAHGICSKVDGETVLLGSRHFIEDDEGVSCEAARPHVERLASQGKTILYVALWAASSACSASRIRSAMRLKASSRHCTPAARRSSCSRVTMSARLRPSRHASASTPGALQVLPSDKADEVLRLKDAGAKVLMIGDGINDSPDAERGRCRRDDARRHGHRAGGGGRHHGAFARIPARRP